ncbi:Nuclear protein localization protein 4-like [Porphyridium purpureum]|uniref:Nuclear protein localization protein 4-like n=1 Tax=Porphyridium purpureum TaxID=35688 RepID=A0A5J4YRZ7_PORPP|nr:Nuclear protein localization protein 4-like [Porphyridium purpureum]|eukprot:POR2988..scf229_5
MLVRVRMPDGTTLRLPVEPNDSVEQVVAKLRDTKKLDEDAGIKLFSDARFLSELLPLSATLKEHAVAHGDFLYVQGAMIDAKVPADNSGASASTERAASAARSASQGEPSPAGPSENRDHAANGRAHEFNSPELETAAEKRSTLSSHCRHGPRGMCEQCGGEPAETRSLGRCKHSPRGMCEHCMPKEDPRERYKRELEKWKGRNYAGTSIAVMEALEALQFKIKPQDSANVLAVSVDQSSANSFQAYLAHVGFSQQRFGFMYGTKTDDSVVMIEAIYEPPQCGDHEAYAPIAGTFDEQQSSAAAVLDERAQRIAEYLSMARMGVIFSAKPRKCILSGADVLFCAKCIVEEEERFGAEHAKSFVIINVALAADGSVMFEAYQLSDQCVEMYKAGVFLEEQKPNSGRVKTRDAVIVEGKETNSVHSEFFLISIPIRGHDSWLRCSFPVENRDLKPQGQDDVVRSVTKHKDVPFHEQLADYHQLLYLCNVFDLHTDMPTICDIALKKREPSDTEHGYKLMFDALASGTH